VTNAFDLKSFLAGFLKNRQQKGPEESVKYRLRNLAGGPEALEGYEWVVNEVTIPCVSQNHAERTVERMRLDTTRVVGTSVIETVSGPIVRAYLLNRALCIHQLDNIPVRKLSPIGDTMLFGIVNPSKAVVRYVLDGGTSEINMNPAFEAPVNKRTAIHY